MINNPTPELPESWLSLDEANFSEIVKVLNIPKKWGEWSYVQESYKDKILKPCMMYTSIFGRKPDIVYLDGDTLVLEQKLYGEIYLLLRNKDFLYSSERVHQRQYFPSNSDYDIDKSSFLSKNCYRFFMPWLLDEDLEYEIVGVDYGSFFVPNQKGKFEKTKKDTLIKNTNFVDFYFTKSNNHMIDKEHGIVPNDSIMYQIYVKSNKEILKKVLACYE